ncbi:MAG: dipeptide epimerase [Pirellulaceae bacterium]|nr:dipeptide epimerase [Pirellulaceae bacterium]
MKLRLHHFDLKLQHPFTISRETHTVQPTLIVELEEGGQTGYGEATSNLYYGSQIDAMMSTLEVMREQIESTTLHDPIDFWHQCAPQLVDEPFVQCALDQAAYDLWGKRLGRPVHQLWGLATEHLPLTNYTIGIDTVEMMVAKMQEYPNWPVYKIKLGTQEDLQIVRQLRQHTTAIFRVDANCGWTAEETVRNSQDFKNLNVEFIEQPLPADDVDGMEVVSQHAVLPIVADESCITESDVERCKELGFDGINIKLVKCGGLTPARRMIQRARELDLKVMVGCMTESTVGISAIAQLLPLLDFVDMDGALLLAKDIATGVSICNGVCEFPQVNGCGVELLPVTPDVDTAG